MVILRRSGLSRLSIIDTSQRDVDELEVRYECKQPGVYAFVLADASFQVYITHVGIAKKQIET